jgi:hypothetical protein
MSHGLPNRVANVCKSFHHSVAFALYPAHVDRECLEFPDGVLQQGVGKAPAARALHREQGIAQLLPVGTRRGNREIADALAGVRSFFA